GAKLQVGGDRATFDPEIAQNRLCERGVFVCPATQVACVQNRQAIGVVAKHLAKCSGEIGVAVFAQPLHLVLIAARTQAKQMRDAREKPAEGVGETKRVKQAKFLAFGEVKRS